MNRTSSSCHLPERGPDVGSRCPWSVPGSSHRGISRLLLHSGPHPSHDRQQSWDIVLRGRHSAALTAVARLKSSHPWGFGLISTLPTLLAVDEDHDPSLSSVGIFACTIIKKSPRHGLGRQIPPQHAIPIQAPHGWGASPPGNKSLPNSKGSAFGGQGHQYALRLVMSSGIRDSNISWSV